MEQKRPVGRPRIHANDAARKKAWRDRHLEEVREWDRNYLKENPGIANAKAAKYRVGDAVVPATDLDAIREIYREAERLRTRLREWHVDHVIPLRGRIVSGLHVAWNLQILPQQANQQKHRKFDQEEESAIQHAFTLARLKA